ncbi:MAG: isoprenyl transferase [Verrucomicrobiota bacterium]
MNESPKFKKVPKHVAIIMDGNGRWAKERSLPRLKGHEQGAEAVREALEAAADIGVKYLTLYAFSVENWSRPKPEVDGLMLLLVDALKRYKKDLIKRQIRFDTIGRVEDLPQKVQRTLSNTIEATSKNRKGTLVLALSYGGRTELVDAVKSVANKVAEGELQASEIDENLISKNLYTAKMPDPDLLIRTSGEMRLSNFLLWQLSYTELYVTPVLWPDFKKENFYEAVREYNSRNRRFGGV